VLNHIEYPYWIEEFYNFYPVMESHFLQDVLLYDEDIDDLTELLSREDELMLDLTGCIDSCL